MRNKIILICGSPGTGKTTLAIKLASFLGIDQVVSTDIVRETLRSLSSKEKSPTLFSTTHESWKFLGEKTQENLSKGSRIHSKVIFNQVVHLINKSEKEGRSMILEGVHLIPEILDYLKLNNSDIFYFYLYIKEKEEHLKRFDLKNKKRSIFHEKWYSNYEDIKIIEENNLEEAKKRALKVIENSSFKETWSQIITQLKNKNEILYV